MIERADVVAKFSETLKVLVQERSALVAADAPPEEIARQDELAADLKTAMESFVMLSTRRAADHKRYAEWQALLPQCSAAKEAYEAAARVVKKQNEDTFAAEDALTRSQSRLGQHLLAEPEPTTYPSAKLVRQWNVDKVRLEKEVQDRQKDLRDLRSRQPETGRIFQAAKQTFERLAWEEMQRRPKQEFPKIVATTFRLQYGPELTPADN